LPGAGETVLAHGVAASPGGKGANQAHAACLQGVPTALVGAVGDDAFADAALRGLQTQGVRLDGVARAPGPTGLAGIAIDDRGENQIVVAPGANALVQHTQVSDALLQRSRALLLQMEVPSAQNFALIARARRLGVPVLLNNAPAQTLPDEVLQAIQVLIVNRHELQASSSGLPGDDEAALCLLADRHGLAVLLTLGDQGLLARLHGQTWRLPAFRVAAVDTTGAGDTFAGVFASARVQGLSTEDALERATVAAALACMQPGAQTAQPTALAVEQALPAYRAQRAGAG
jgi:ribokinase